MNKGNNFKLGLFVSLAVAILLVFLLSLGVLDRFRARVPFETYFKENIRGLAPGAPFRYRGIQAGSVREIHVASDIYTIAEHDQVATGWAIRVVVDVDRSVFGNRSEDEIRERIRDAVENGLRFRLASTGLGGPTYVEADRIDDLSLEVFQPAWEPRHIYIPSVPSTAGTIVESLASILRRLNNSKLDEEIARVAELAEHILTALDGFGETGVVETANSSLEELRAASADLRAFLGDDRIGSLMDEASGTLAGISGLVDEDGRLLDAIDRLSGMAQNLDRAASGLERLTAEIEERELIAEAQTALETVGPIAGDVSDAVRSLDSSLDGVDRVVRSNETALADTIRSLRRAALQIESLIEDLKANPSQLLADPPARRSPGPARGTPREDTP
jgi:ABC-type transporter Mla subunit MlaD